MRIRGWQVDGFGVLRDHKVTGLPDGLTIIYGPNEAGKSTLLAFIRGVLFGFPGADVPDHRYATVPGGDAGGTVVLEGHSGVVAVTRAAVDGQAPEIVLPGGRTGTDADLRALLGNADTALFRSVFAFSLSELQAFDTLPRHEVRERILSAAIAGAGRSARAAITDMEARADSLVRPGGPIAELLTELEGHRRRLAEAQAVAATYGELREEAERLETEIPTLAAKIDESRTTVNRGRLLLDCWPDYEKAEQAKRELTDLLAIVKFPWDPEARLGAANRAIGEAAAALRTVGAAQAETEEAMRPLVVDPALAAVAYQVDELERALPLHRDRRARREAALQLADEADGAVVEQLRAAGPAWSEARLAGEEGAADRRDEVREWGNRLSAASAEVEHRKADLAKMTSRLEELDRLRGEVRSLFAAQEPPGQDALDEREVQAHRLRDAFTAYRNAEADTSLRESIVAERRRAVEGGETAVAPLVPAWVMTIGFALAVVAAGVAVQRVVVSDVAAALGFALLAVALGLSVLGVRVIDRRLVLQAARGAKAVSVRQLELDDAIRARDESRERADALRAALLREAAPFGIDGTPTAEAVQGIEEALAADVASRARWDELLAKLGDTHNQTRASEAEVQQAEELVRQAEAELRRTNDAWAAWQAEIGTPAILPPAQVLELLAGIRAARLALRERNRQRSESVDLATEIEAWEERARTTLSASAAGSTAGPAGPLTGDDLITAFVEVRNRCAEDRRTRATLARLQEELLRREPQIAAAERALARAEAERDELFASVGVVDEGGFRERLAVHTRQLQLRAQIGELESQLVGRIGRGDEASSVRAELRRGRVDQWKADTAASETALERASIGRDGSLKRHGEIQERLRSIELSGEVATLEVGLEGLRTELERRAHEWRTLTSTVGLIEVALGQLARTRQPAVVADAARMFRAVTGGRYVTIEQDDTGAGLLLVESDGLRKEVDDLSRGTAEQLYLCLRLGLAADRARRGEAPPIVMDDVLVNFDEARARAVAGVLATVSLEQQVLMFTCHRNIRDLMRDVVHDLRIIELDTPALEVAAERPRSRSRARSAAAPAPAAGEEGKPGEAVAV